MLLDDGYIMLNYISGCSLRLDKNINDSASCSAAGGVPNDTISICYNETVTPAIPMAIMNSTLADEKGYSSVLPSEEYLKYVAYILEGWLYFIL